MTQEQIVAVNSLITADPILSTLPKTGDGGYDAMRILNTEAEPAFIVWNTTVEVEKIMRNGMDWARVDNLSVGKARIWDWMTRLGTINSAKANIRAGIDATWVGTAADLAVRAQVYTHCKRNATRVEKLFATGTGTDASPATMVFEGSINLDDAIAALML